MQWEVVDEDAEDYGREALGMYAPLALASLAIVTTLRQDLLVARKLPPLLPVPGRIRGAPEWIVPGQGKTRALLYRTLTGVGLAVADTLLTAGRGVGGLARGGVAAALYVARNAPGFALLAGTRPREAWHVAVASAVAAAAATGGGVTRALRSVTSRVPALANWAVSLPGQLTMIGAFFAVVFR